MEVLYSVICMSIMFYNVEQFEAVKKGVKKNNLIYFILFFMELNS